MTEWHVGTLKDSKKTASDIKSLFFEVENWHGHLAGQYCDLQLANISRTYSIASSQDEKFVEFGIQLLPKGEFSPLLWGLKIGEQIEISPPGGQHFVWTPKMREPLILIAGGSGICPLLAIYKAAKRKATFIVSAKSVDKIMYYEELKNEIITCSHLNQKFLQEKLNNIDKSASIYISGSTSFVEAITDQVNSLGFSRICTERFT